jgi:hypothetical protein
VRSFEELLDEYLDSLTGVFTVGTAAPRFHEFLRENHPDELRVWLLKREPTFVARALGDRIRSRRGQIQRARRPSAFQQMVAAWEGGDLQAPREYSTVYVVDRYNTRRRVGEMSASDHQFVATRYGAGGRRSLLLAEFHRQVASRLGDRTTADAIPEIEYAKMRVQVLGGEVPALPAVSVPVAASDD